MLKRLAGLGLFAMLLCVPLQADHKRHRSRHHEGYYPSRGYVEVYVGTPYGHGAFVRGYRPVPYGYSRYSHDHYYGDGRREFRKYKNKRRHYFKRHKHYHYDGYCPY